MAFLAVHVTLGASLRLRGTGWQGAMTEPSHKTTDAPLYAPKIEHFFTAESDAAAQLYRGCTRSINDTQLAALEASLGIRGPDIIMIGAQKGGTTSFSASTSSIMCTSRSIEPHFFDDVRFEARQVGMSDLATYLSTQWVHCSGAMLQLPNFEKSPGLASQAWAAQRICEALGSSRAKLVMLLREPVSRAYSSFWQSLPPHYPLPQTPEGFHVASMIEVQLVRECGGLYVGDMHEDWKLQPSFATCCARVALAHGISSWPGCKCEEASDADHYSYLASGGSHECGVYGDKRAAQVRNSVYVTQVSAYLRYFHPRDLFMAEDHDIYANFDAFARELAVSALPTLTRARYNHTESANLTETKMNLGGDYPPILNETAEMLTAFFRPYNRQFFALIGRELTW